MRRLLLALALTLLSESAFASCIEYLRQSTASAVIKYQRYWVCDTEAERPNGIAAGDRVYTKNTGKSWVWTSGSAWADMGESGGGGAPSTATYLTQTPDAGLSAEQAMSALTTGLVKNTTSTGVQSIYGGTSCAASQWTISLDGSGAASCSQPTFSDLGGTATDGQIPNTITLDNLTQVTTRAIADTTGTLTVSRGGTGAAPGADDQLLVSDSASAATWRTLTTCTGAGKALTYDAATNTFGCNTISGGGLTLTVVEKDLGTAARYSGTFDITGLSGLTVNAPVLVQQAAGPYTGKGDRQDEAEMDLVTATGYVVDANTIRVYWTSRGAMVGNVRFQYALGG